MTRTIRVLLMTALLAWPHAAGAQSVLETVWSDLRTAPGDLFHVWTGPARIGGDDVPELVLFTGATALLAVNDGPIQEWVQSHPRSAPVLLLDPFRSDQPLSHLGQNHWVLRGAGAGYVIGLATGQEWLREASFGCALGNTSNALPRKAVYSLISRMRPSASDDPYDIDVPGGDWSEHSFFGGHAANAFTCASFLAHRFEFGAGETVVWAIATGVAAARLVDDAHWASDTFIGSAFGWYAGRAIAHRHLARQARAEAERDREDGPPGEGAGAAGGWRIDGLSAAPVRTADGAALVVSARLVF